MISRRVAQTEFMAVYLKVHERKLAFRGGTILREHSGSAPVASAQVLHSVTYLRPGPKSR